MPETPAHTQTETTRLRLFYPSHEPRAEDPHYAIFNACRKKLKDAGKLVCWVCGQSEEEAGAPIQLHHSLCEFALVNGIDVQKFALDHPQFNLTDDESFFAFVEGPGNLLPLCVKHHISSEGIHLLPYPVWENLKYEKTGLPAFGEVVHPGASVTVTIPAPPADAPPFISAFTVVPPESPSVTVNAPADSTVTVSVDPPPEPAINVTVTPDAGTPAHA